MKKLFLLLLLAFCLITSPKLAHAQESDTNPSILVKYDLAYPGILPDNPLYKLKVLRDKITEFLISDPRQKAEFYLLQADKGILASSILIDKKEIKLAEETALKAENNYTDMVLQVKKMSIKPDEKFISNIKKAALKHQEVINLLVQRVPDQKDKEVFGNVLYFSKSNLDTVGNYINKHRFQQ